MTRIQDDAVVRGRVPRFDRVTLVWGVAVLSALIVGWWIFSISVNPLVFPSPYSVLRAFIDMAVSGELWVASASTIVTFAVALAAAIVLGIGLGLLVAESRLAGSIANPIATALYATPVIVLVPLVIIWFGVGDLGRIMIVFLGAVIPIYINAETGFRNARRDLVEVARSFGAKRGLMLTEVVIPGAIPYIMTGLKIGVGRALGSVIIAEIFLNLSGLGGLIQTSVAYLRVDKMIAASLLLALGGTLLMLATTRLENRFDAWRSAR
jgi:ABC-type nitrate/sulfonate/bicarbonate transport system permease component